MSCNSSFSERNLCSNHGYFCTSPPVGCICDDGWTGLGDFAPSSGFDCDINKTSLTVLFSLIIAASIINGAQILRYLILRSYEKKVFFYISWQPRMLFPWIFVIELLFQVAYSSIKLAYGQDLLVGRDMSITCVLESTVFLSFYGLCLYFLVVLKFLQTYTTMLTKERKDKLNDLYSFLRVVISLIPVLAFVSSYITLIGIIFPRYERVFAIASLCGIGTLSLLYGWITTTALNNLRSELSSHISNFPLSSDDIKLVLKRLTIAYRILLIMSPLMGVSYFIFCTDYLLRKSTYLIIWLHLGWPGMATIIVTTVSQITNNRPTTNRMKNNNTRCKVMGIDNIDLSSMPPNTSQVQSQIQSV